MPWRTQRSLAIAKRRFFKEDRQEALSSACYFTHAHFDILYKTLANEGSAELILFARVRKDHALAPF